MCKYSSKYFWIQDVYNACLINEKSIFVSFPIKDFITSFPFSRYTLNLLESEMEQS